MWYLYVKTKIIMIFFIFINFLLVFTYFLCMCSAFLPIFLSKIFTNEIVTAQEIYFQNVWYRGIEVKRYRGTDDVPRWSIQYLWCSITQWLKCLQATSDGGIYPNNKLTHQGGSRGKIISRNIIGYTRHWYVLKLVHLGGPLKKVKI